MPTAVSVPWTSDTYKTYLRSDHWKQVRSRTRRHYHSRCANCGKYSHGAGDVHHINYDSIGKERPGKDVVFLCRDCHKGHHKHTVILRSDLVVKPKRKKKQSMRGCGGLWNSRDYRRHLKNNPPKRTPPTTGVVQPMGCQLGTL